MECVGCECEYGGNDWGQFVRIDIHPYQVVVSEPLFLPQRQQQNIALQVYTDDNIQWALLFRNIQWIIKYSFRVLGQKIAALGIIYP